MYITKDKKRTVAAKGDSPFWYTVRLHGGRRVLFLRLFLHINLPVRLFGATAAVFTAVNMIFPAKFVSILSFGLFAVGDVIVPVYHVRYEKHIRRPNSD